MTRRFAALAFAASLAVTALAVPAPAAALETPKSMAATGDSITRAFNLCFFPFTDCPAQSWSTGTSTTVNSHALRFKITNKAYNDAVSGAKMADLPGQMNTVYGRNVDYVTVLMGGNDVCTDTEGGMTSPSAYATAFIQAMDTLKADASPPLVYVVSVPNVKMLWEVLKDDSSARSAWSRYTICQSLLANPLSMEQVDVDRRERVKQRNMELNQRLRSACAAYSFCRFDGEAAFGTPFVANDVSTRDYFHPSTAGQAKLSEVSFTHGYWGTAAVNAPPEASFTYSCPELTCTFSNSSTDPDGVGGWSWNFDTTGTGSTSDEQSPVHTYPSAGTYTVTMHAIDRYGATASTTQSVVVGGGDGTSPTTGSIAGTVKDTSGNAIGGATVTVSGPETASTTTGSDGSYLIAELDTGDYTVTASAANFDPASTTTTVKAGETASANLVLTPTATAEPDSMWVESLDGVAVRVNRNFWRADVTVHVVGNVDGTTTSLAGATVTGSFSTGGTASCTTGSGGTCSVSSANLRNNVAGTTFTVSTVDHPDFQHDSARSVLSTTVAQPA